MAESDRPRQSSAGREDKAPFWERAVALLGLLLVLGSLGFLLYEGIWGDDSPPDVIVVAEPAIDRGGRYLVPFTVRNQGGQTAAEVRITGTLSRDGQPLEQAETSFDFVPAGSTGHGGLYFREDPRKARLELSASGYRRP